MAKMSVEKPTISSNKSELRKTATVVLSVFIDDSYKPVRDFLKSKQKTGWQRILTEATFGVLKMINNGDDTFYKKLDKNPELDEFLTASHSVLNLDGDSQSVLSFLRKKLLPGPISQDRQTLTKTVSSGEWEE